MSCRKRERNLRKKECIPKNVNKGKEKKLN